MPTQSEAFNGDFKTPNTDVGKCTVLTFLKNWTLKKRKLRISTVLLLSRPFGSFSEPFKAFRSGYEFLDMTEAQLGHQINDSEDWKQYDLPPMKRSLPFLY